MRYVHDLIPASSKVLPEYFKGVPYTQGKHSKLHIFLCFSGAIIFFICALTSLLHPVLFLFYIIMGLGLLPKVHHWVEKKLQFNFTTAVKTCSYGLFIIPVIILSVYYGKIDKEIADRQHIQDAIRQQEKRIAEAKDSIRRDSLSFYLNKLKKPQSGNKQKEREINEDLQYAFSLALTQEEKGEVLKLNFDINKANAIRLVQMSKYEAALPALNQLLQEMPQDVSLLYNRALCYDKLGRIENAVSDLKRAMSLGSTVAENLHNKVNPVRKRIVDYVTRCCDGSISYAKGRGACSWHGGVCNWNEPVYETYRKYE